MLAAAWDIAKSRITWALLLAEYVLDLTAAGDGMRIVPPTLWMYPAWPIAGLALASGFLSPAGNNAVKPFEILVSACGRYYADAAR